MKSNDTDPFDDGDGIIKYMDGNNEVTVSGRTFKLKQDNIYESTETNPADRLQVQLDANTNTLNVLGLTYFKINNFQSGHFNITLDNVPEEIIYANLFEGTVGDDNPSDFAFTNDNDEIRTFAGNDVANGGGGNDLLVGGNGDDVLEGEAGDDILQGDAGRDLLIGFIGNDQLQGGTETDLLAGGQDNDILSGDAGNDVLLGGDGADVLLGGDGIDLLMANGGTGTVSIFNWDVQVNAQGQFILSNISL